MALSKLAKEAAKKAAAAARKASGEVGKARRAAKAKEEAAKKAANKKVDPKEKATQKGLRLAKKPTTQEGMGLDSITGRDVRAASDVDKGKAGKVTRSTEPGFLQSQRTAGSRARAKTKVEAEQKARTGDTAAAATVKKMEKKDVVDTARATAKSAQSRKKNTKASLPELKSVPTERKAAAKPPINPRTGEINDAAFDKLTKNQQEAAIRNVMARLAGPRKRELQAMLDNMKPTKAGESGVRARAGGPKGMQGATSRNIKDIDEGVSRGRGGLDFSIGGMATKNYVNPVKIVDNRKKR
jgi:hypothetical protein